MLRAILYHPARVDFKSTRSKRVACLVRRGPITPHAPIDRSEEKGSTDTEGARETFVSVSR